MKKSFKLLAAAFAIVAAASCAKEVAPETPAVGGESVKTFTASLGTDSKIAVAADGKVTWTAGDIVIIYNGNNATYVDRTTASKFNEGNIQTITVTDEMISDAGKTLKFTTTLDAPAAGKKWYFFATSDIARVYRIRETGIAICSPEDITTQGEIPFLASASCENGQNSISFKHALGLLRMTASSWVYKVTVESNNYDSGASGNKQQILQEIDLNPANGNVIERNPDKGNLYRADLNDVPVNAPFYIALSPHTFANGITIKVYTSSGSWNANPKTPEKVVTINKPFTVEAGKIINLGNILADHAKYDTYYEMWEAGQDITIGGVKYNKATSGLTAMHITADTHLANGVATYWNKIIFVDEGVTVDNGATVDNSASFRMDNTVFVGNTIGKRSNLVFRTKIWSSAQNTSFTSEMFKNMNVKVEYTNDYFCWIRKGNKRIVIDDCSFDMPREGFQGAWGATDCEDFYMCDSEIRISADGKAFVNRVGGTNVTVCNNIFYAASGNHIIDFADCDETDLSWESVKVENNSFINLRGEGNNGAFRYVAYENLSVKNNLLVYTEDAGLPNQLFVVRGTSNAATKVSMNRDVTAGYLYTVSGAAGAFVTDWSWSMENTGGVQGAWVKYNTATYGLASNPYSTMDCANGVFVNTTSYGAQR